ncbi:MAG: DUF4198 domain-containing protein [Planctomycetes bacterium]|nr:DUF4198 domain-containing protein [Planctomycetota bacterium]
MQRFTIAVLFLAAVVPGAFAHDFWIEASNYRPVVKERVSFDLKVGEHFVGDSVERNSDRIVRFTAVDALGKAETILGIDRRAPAGLWAPIAAGLFAVGYESNTIAIELEAEKFEHYLAAEGLEHVSAARKARGETGKRAREIYARSVKSLVWVRTDARDALPTSGFDTRIGLPLEIVPEQNPYALKIGDELTLRVYFEGAPLAGALVGFMSHAEPQSEVRLRSQADGRLKVRITHAGPNLARVCWMVAAPQDSGADWKSTWSSLTFDVQPPTPAK